MDDFVERRIKEREQRISALNKNISDLIKTRRDLEAELRAYRDVMSHFSGKSITPDGNKDKIETDDKFSLVHGSNVVIRQRSRMSEVWKNTVSYMFKQLPNSTNIDDLRKFFSDNNIEMSDDSLRSQLSVYTARGWLERVSTGSYKPTETGVSAAGVALNASPPVSEPDSALDTDDVSEDNENAESFS